ncbi:AAA family ATPase [Herbiconiux daphne]|uniref:AAA family ATPase n=1 Tax=Herbiconiux daphne TaxID=2970914 RepID=A0ABT2H022_9MICO|nr:AAA family ATPase [Herbiconiux daphne]MCS5733107.1 AAA family ATPase [Herbiconiux daphne]
MTVPAVAQLQGGLELDPGVTFLVGENGSGKSTVLEGIAMAFGFPAEGGSRNGGGSTRASESPLGEWLKLDRGLVAPRWGFFLRAETMHSYYSYLEQLPGSPDGDLHEMSHGARLPAGSHHPRARRVGHPPHRVGAARARGPLAPLPGCARPLPASHHRLSGGCGECGVVGRACRTFGLGSSEHSV